MLRLITTENTNPTSLPSIADTKLRQTFADVFAAHYVNLIWQVFDESEEKKAFTLNGFGDLIQKFILREDISKLSSDEIILKLKNHGKEKTYQDLHKLYFGIGFDDEVAFILAFAGYKPGDKTPKEYYEQVTKQNLEKKYQDEVDPYFAELAKDNRELLEVNFLALIGPKNTVHGFAIYHLFKKGDETILHIRQSAMRTQGRGYASLFARYLADHYPHAKYEANQRHANKVPFKQNLLDKNIIRLTNSVLGYPQRYTGLFANQSLSKSLCIYFGITPGTIKDSLSDQQIKQLGIERNGQYWEAESISPGFFSAGKLERDLFLDDCFVPRARYYLK